MPQPTPLSINKSARGERSRPTGNFSSAWHSLGRTQTVRPEEAIERELASRKRVDRIMADTKGEIDEYLGVLFKENPETYDEYLSAMASYDEVEGESEGEDDEKTLNGDDEEGDEWTEENKELLQETLSLLEKMDMGTAEDRQEIEEKTAEVQSRLDKMLSKMKDQIEQDKAALQSSGHPDPWKGHPDKKTEADMSQAPTYHPIMEYTMNSSISEARILRNLKIKSVEVFFNGKVTRAMREQIRRVGKVAVEYFEGQELSGAVLQKDSVEFTVTVLLRNPEATTGSLLKFLVNPTTE